MTKQWEDHRHIIIREYKDNNKPLHEVKKFMEERYRFKASIRAYRSRFDRWRVRKYTCRKRRDSLGAKSDDSDKSVYESSEDSTSTSSGTDGSPLRVRSPLQRISSSQQDSSIHYIGSGMYESATATSTSTEDFLTSPPIFDQPLRQLYPTDTDHHHQLAGLFPDHASGLHSHSSRGGPLVSNNNFRYPFDTTTQAHCATGIYRLVNDPVFHHSKFINKGCCSQPILDHCSPPTG